MCVVVLFRLMTPDGRCNDSTENSSRSQRQLRVTERDSRRLWLALEH
jgi:hypothetical protein